MTGKFLFETIIQYLGDGCLFGVWVMSVLIVLTASHASQEKESSLKEELI